MRINTSILVALGSLGLASLSTPALAGGCGGGVPFNQCNQAVNYIPGPAPVYGPVTMRGQNPMGHLRSIHFQAAPNVSVMRVHGLPANANLSDAPCNYTQGCNPVSTEYCRTDVAPRGPGPVPCAAPVMPRPVAMPVMAPPPQPALRTFVGQGYNPANFASRQYGSNDFTPGIAYIPTSIVDRNPAHADMALNSGRAVPQRVVSGGMAPRPHMVGGGFNRSHTVMQSMVRTNVAPTYNHGAATAPVQAHGGTYASNVGTDGSYWEKVSGPTKFGNTMATQVICKRQLPRQVVRPVVGVPTPVPTPVPCAAPAPNSAWTY